MKIRPVTAKLLHADGRTDGDMMKLIVVFRSFAKAAKNGDETALIMVISTKKLKLGSL